MVGLTRLLGEGLTQTCAGSDATDPQSGQ